MSPEMRALFAIVLAHSHGLSSPQLHRLYVMSLPVVFKAFDIAAYRSWEIFGVPESPKANVRTKDMRYRSQLKTLVIAIVVF